MGAKLKAFFTTKELLVRVFVTVLILIVFRLGAAIVVPGVSIDSATQSSTFDGSSVFGIFNLLGGGALRQFSLLSLGVSPYITASIITQLLSTDVVPPLTRMAKGGERGRKKLDFITRILAVIISLIQAVAISATLRDNNVITFPFRFDEAFSFIYIMVVLTGGSLFALFLADTISTKGIGNGASLVIFSGIISVLPTNFINLFRSIANPESPASLFTYQIFLYLTYVIFYFVLILGVVFVNQSVRQIPVQNTGSGLSLKEEQISYLPLKVNSAGVIPVIFASSIITLPLTIGEFFPQGTPLRDTLNIIFGLNSYGLIMYAALIIVFSFFYASIQINPDQLSENFQKNGSFIPGVRPGEETTKYIKSTLFRLTILGASFLTFIAVIPYLVSIIATNIPSQLAFGGTGLIILVGVAIDTTQQIDGRLTQKEYGRFRARQEAMLSNKFSSESTNTQENEQDKIQGIW